MNEELKDKLLLLLGHIAMIDVSADSDKEHKQKALQLAKEVTRELFPNLIQGSK